MSARSAFVRLAPLVSIAVVAAPRFAHACAVCMSGREDEVQLAFIATTVLLSVLPLLAVGGFVWWLRRRLRELESAQAERLVPSAPGTPLD